MLEIIITKPRDRDFAAIAKLHQDSIEEGFLSTLGVSFLSVLYKGISEAPQSGVIVAIEGGCVLGFISYTSDISKCYRWVISHRFLSLTLRLVPNIFNLAVYKKCFETLLYPFKHKAESSNDGKAQKARAELLSVAVSDLARGKGIGKMLVTAIDEKFRELGVSEYSVVTHGIDERSNQFYVKCGFQLVRSFQNHGKPMNEYWRRI